MPFELTYFVWICLLGTKQSDAYQATGCYNLLCSGFIQINSQIAMGASISPVSGFHNPQYDISITIWKVKTSFYLLELLSKYHFLSGHSSKSHLFTSELQTLWINDCV